MNNNLDATRFYVKDSEIVSVVERLLANIKKEMVNISGVLNYLPILQAIEQALNSPNPNIPITDINTGDYNNAPIQTKQYQNTQYLKAITAILGQYTEHDADGLTLMQAIGMLHRQQMYGKLHSTMVYVSSGGSYIHMFPYNVIRKLIIHNRSNANIFLVDNSVQSASQEGIMIMPNEKLTLDWLYLANNTISLIADYGNNNTVTIHAVHL